MEIGWQMQEINEYAEGLEAESLIPDDCVGKNGEIAFHTVSQDCPAPIPSGPISRLL